MGKSTGLLILLALTLVLAACGGSKGEASRLVAVSLDEFPQGIGRGFPAGAASGRDEATIGQVAPDFALQLADGRGVHLSDLKGRPVLINFWATWCPPCRAEMPDLVALHKSNPNLHFVSVNVREKQDVVEPFAQAFDMDMPVVVDEDGLVSDLYGIRSMPTTVFVDSNGQIIYLYKGMLTAELMASFAGLLK